MEDQEQAALAKLSEIYATHHNAPFISLESAEVMNNSEEYNIPLRIKKYNIRFFYGGKEYDTVFKLKSFMGGRRGRCSTLTFYNDCFYLNYYCNYGYYEHKIQADTESSCFVPPLEGSQLDVLRILSLKLSLANPFSRKISASNVAKKGDVRISMAKMLRGEPTLYERYGYVNPLLTETLEKIKTYQFHVLPEELQEIIRQVIRERSGEEIPEDALLVDVMKKIGKEDEKTELLKTYPFEERIYGLKKTISNVVYQTLVNSQGLTNDFTLNFIEDSPEWDHMKKRLYILSIDEIPTGGKRRTRHTRRNKKKRITRKRGKGVRR